MFNSLLIVVRCLGRRWCGWISRHSWNSSKSCGLLYTARISHHWFSITTLN